METEPILKIWNREGIGKPAGIDSFYGLEELYGAKRYKHPLYFKIFSKGGRKDYLEALHCRYLALLDYLFFEKEVRPLYKEIFLQELEDLITELRALKVPPVNLKNFLKTKGSESDPLYERILSMIQEIEAKESVKEYFPPYSSLLKRLIGISLAALAVYIYFRFALLA